MLQYDNLGTGACSLLFERIPLSKVLIECYSGRVSGKSIKVMSQTLLGSVKHDIYYPLRNSLSQSDYSICNLHL